MDAVGKNSGLNGAGGRTELLLGSLAALAGVGLTTAVIQAVPGAAAISNISSLYLLAVLATALRFGSTPAIVASLLSFLAFNWFFTQPRYTLRVAAPGDWLALLMFLLTAITTGHLTAAARRQAQEAQRRERETAALADASRAAAAQPNRNQALRDVLARLVRVLPVSEAAVLTADEPEPEVAAHWPAEGGGAVGVRDGSRQVLRGEAPLGRAAPSPGEAHTSGEQWIFLPLTAESSVLGVLQARLPGEYSVTAAERRVVDSLANLAAVILEREQHNREQAKAQALAEADRLKTALLSMVSHDFRSPLASIKASATACLQGEDHSDPAVQHDLHLGIIREADRLNGMVGNILALSRLEADAWRPQREEAALEEVVEAARSGLPRGDNERVEVALGEDLREVWLDPVQIGQVLHNLLDNALKYSPGGLRVELRVLRSERELIFEVADRGPGLPAGEEQRVFERFYRAPALRESAVPGVGIGLSVCRGLVEAHGGTLTAENREGGGAVFRMVLPQGADE